MEVSALKHAGVAGIHGRSPLLRLQSDERLIALTRRGNQAAFEAIVSRYQSRLLAFCRHMLGSREDAEDVLQEVFSNAFNAILADGRDINARPWLYRIARNRCLNHLRRAQAIGVDSMDVHFADGGATTADRVHQREEFRSLIADVGTLPESQRTALLLREIDALSYDQIAEAMETTVPSVKSLLVRARVSLAELAESRRLTCEEVRHELGEVAEGLKRASPPVRRHLKACDRCAEFRKQLDATNRALAAVLPIGPLVLLKKLALAHLGTTAGAGGATAAGTAATAGGAVGGAAIGSAAGGALSAGIGAVATKAAAGLAAAALVTAGAVEVKRAAVSRPAPAVAAAATPTSAPVPVASAPQPRGVTRPAVVARNGGDAKRGDREQPGPTPPREPAAPAAPVLAPPPATQEGSDTTTLPGSPPATTNPTGGAIAPDEPPAGQPPPEQPAPEQPPAEQPPPEQPAPEQPPAGQPAPPTAPLTFAGEPPAAQQPPAPAPAAGEAPPA